MAEYFLLRNDGENWQVCLELTTPAVRIGRGEDNDLTLDDRHCSRQHAVLRCEDNDWYLNDCGSQNGTWVNQKQLSGECLLTSGTRFCVGKTYLAFVNATDARALCESAESSSAVESVSDWLDDLKQSQGHGVETARMQLWERYYGRLAALARSKAGEIPRRVEDEEDAVVSAFGSFFAGVERGQFPKLDDRNDLWRILATITARKVCRQVERQMAQKRGCGKVGGESVFEVGDGSDKLGGIENAAAVNETDQRLTLEFDDTWRRYMQELPDETHRLIAEKRIQGFTNAEIASRIGTSERTVERRVNKIREIWDRFCGDDS